MQKLLGLALATIFLLNTVAADDSKPEGTPQQQPAKQKPPQRQQPQQPQLPFLQLPDLNRLFQPNFGPPNPLSFLNPRSLNDDDKKPCDATEVTTIVKKKKPVVVVVQEQKKVVVPECDSEAPKAVVKTLATSHTHDGHIIHTTRKTSLGRRLAKKRVSHDSEIVVADDYLHRRRLGNKRLDYNRLAYKDLDYNDLGHHGLGHRDLGYKDLGYDGLGYKDLDYYGAGYKGLGYKELGHNDLAYKGLGYNRLGYDGLLRDDLHRKRQHRYSKRIHAGLGRYSNAYDEHLVGSHGHVAPRARYGRVTKEIVEPYPHNGYY